MRDELLTIWQAARELAVTSGTIRVWIKSRRIGVVRLGVRTVRIRRSELERLIAAGTIPAEGCPIIGPSPVVITGSAVIQ